MPLVVKITETSKGPTLKLNLAIMFSYLKNETSAATSQISQGFNVDDVAEVRIKTSASKPDYNTPAKYTMSVSTMKNKLAKDVEIKMNVTCNTLKFSKSWICSDDWTDSDMGQITCSLDMEHPDSKIYLVVLEMRVNVQKVNKPSFIKLYDDSDFTDFHLSTQGGIVAFHKAFLAAHSDVFKTMFTGNWKETNENMLEMKNYSLETVKHMKDFLYLFTLPDNYDDLCSLTVLAGQYCIADLKAECVRKLVENVSPENLYSVHEFACKNNLPELTYALIKLTSDDIVKQSHEYEKKQTEKIKQTT